MSPDFIDKWEHILEDVEKNKIPVEFIKKLIIKQKVRSNKRLIFRSYFNKVWIQTK